MSRLMIHLIVGFLLIPFSGVMADDAPTASPKMTIETTDGTTEETQYSGSAPIVAHFTANPENLGAYTPHYEWHIYMSGKEANPYLVRFDENLDYTFMQSGTSYIKLYVTFVNGTDTIQYEQEEPLSVTASESILNMPNAFSPNGDGQNDVFKAKDDYKSIIEFHGYIFNRWGKKLFEWKDITSGWDGKYHGSDVGEGVYFCLIEAKGAEGRVYKIRKAVTLLRGYTEDSSSTGK